LELNGVIVNGLVGEAPPPGVGFTIDTFTVAAETNALAANATVTCVPLTKFVTCAVPFSCTTDLAKNPDPFTVNTNAAAPAWALAGAIEEMEGTGKLTSKLTELDRSAPELVTKTVSELASLSKDEGTTAVIVVLFTKVVINSV
jgi:hypothetical protein